MGNKFPLIEALGLIVEHVEHVFVHKDIPTIERDVVDADLLEAILEAAPKARSYADMREWYAKDYEGPCPGANTHEGRIVGIQTIHKESEEHQILRALVKWTESTSIVKYKGEPPDMRSIHGIAERAKKFLETRKAHPDIDQLQKEIMQAQLDIGRFNPFAELLKNQDARK